MRPTYSHPFLILSWVVLITSNGQIVMFWVNKRKHTNRENKSSSKHVYIHVFFAELTCHWVNWVQIRDYILLKIGQTLYLYLRPLSKIKQSYFFLLNVQYNCFPGYKPKYQPPPPPPQVYQQCKEVAQETCYNIPQVIEKEIEVSILVLLHTISH